MATLTINFTASANAVKYRVKHRKVGTTPYTTVETTQSPVVISNIDCGSQYEGSVQAICFEGIPCNRYEINNSGEDTGILTYTDCVTGLSQQTDISPYMTFFVCSRTVPIESGDAASQTGVTQVAQTPCVSPSPEQASGLVYWNAAALPCPTTNTYYYQVTACEPETAPAVPNGEVKYLGASPLPLGTVVRLSGSTYVGWCYTLADYGAFSTSAISVIDTEENCEACPV
jgi:hypothetical protein